MNSRENVFVNYYHDGRQDGTGEADSDYGDIFEGLCRNQFDLTVSGIVDEEVPSSSGDDTLRSLREELLGNSAVTVVLIGNETWRRKHVDWTIAASLQHTQVQWHSGLVGILLPSFLGKRYPLIPNDDYVRLENSKALVKRQAIPERLAINLDNGFARLYDWSDDPGEVQQWIHEALLRRDSVIPDNALSILQRNR
jgi:hypothetical protein